MGMKLDKRLIEIEELIIAVHKGEPLTDYQRARIKNWLRYAGSRIWAINCQRYIKERNI